MKLDREKKYSVYILRCLKTGCLSLGQTSDLNQRMAEIRSGEHRERLLNPELVHIEQHNDEHAAQVRVEQIRRNWRQVLSWVLLTDLSHPWW